MKARTLGVMLSVSLVLAVIWSVSAGSSGVSAVSGIYELLIGESTPASMIVMHVRLPRTLAAIISGAALACSGAIIQAALMNPLAGPNVIGVNAGAGLSTLVICAFFPTAVYLIPLGAFAGALIASMTILFIAGRTGASRLTIVLSGVAISSVLSALGDLIKTLRPEATLGTSGFMIGGLSGVAIDRLLGASCYIVPALALAIYMTRVLDVMQLGDEVASSLGLRVRLARVGALALASVLAGAAVSFAGLMGFVGLIVPHAVRRLSGGEYRALLPLSMAGGALLVLVCDTVARCAFPPYELPVGILLSLIGGPAFLALIIKNRRGGAL